VARRKKKERRALSQDAPGSFGASLGDLLRGGGLEVPEAAAGDDVAPSEGAARAASAGAETFGLADAGRLVLRRERRRRRGKTVTLLQGLDPARVDLTGLARALGKALGCGSGVEDDAVMLQGDMTGRAEGWLRAHGARDIVRG
jgi:translation initiation factor 1